MVVISPKGSLCLYVVRKKIPFYVTRHMLLRLNSVMGELDALESEGTAHCTT